MTEREASCAHLKVSWRTKYNKEDMTTTGWWECDSGCGTRFQAQTAVVVCPTCRGTGKSDGKNTSDICPDCYGTGRERGLPFTVTEASGNTNKFMPHAEPVASTDALLTDDEIDELEHGEYLAGRLPHHIQVELLQAQDTKTRQHRDKQWEQAVRDEMRLISYYGARPHEIDTFVHLLSGCFCISLIAFGNGGNASENDFLRMDYAGVSNWS